LIFHISKRWRGPRALAALVAFGSLLLVTEGSPLASGCLAALTAGLAIWLQAAGDFAWVRRLGWFSVAIALAINLLRMQDTVSGFWQACLSQLLFGLMVAITVGQGNPLRARYGLTEHGPVPLFAVAALLLQGALGAAVRHDVADTIPHVAGAIITTGIVMWAGAQALINHIKERPIRRSAMLLLSLTFSQVLLGMAAYMSRLAASAQQASAALAWFPALHAWVGSLTLGAAVRMALLVYRQMHPEDAELAHGGVAIA
jgi:hypothetical protein